MLHRFVVSFWLILCFHMWHRIRTMGCLLWYTKWCASWLSCVDVCWQPHWRRVRCRNSSRKSRPRSTGETSWWRHTFFAFFSCSFCFKCGCGFFCVWKINWNDRGTNKEFFRSVSMDLRRFPDWFDSVNFRLVSKLTSQLWLIAILIYSFYYYYYYYNYYYFEHRPNIN